MASNTTVPVILNTTLLNDPASQSDGMYHHNNEYIPYFSASYYIIMTLYITYIPLISVPSAIVIAATIMVKNHHNAHHILLMAVSTSDLLMALINIPFRVLVNLAVTRESINSADYRGLCFSLDAIGDITQIASLICLTVLGLDVLVQMTFPIKYRRHASIKKAIACLVTILSLSICIIVSFTILKFGINVDCSFPMGGLIERTYEKVIAIFGGTLLFSCLVTGIYVRYKRCKLKTNTGRTTSLLLMMFIVFYIPSLILLSEVTEIDKAATEVWWHIARLILYLSPLTNGLLIPYYRPAYKFAFKYFLSTNPMNWNKLENNFKKYINSSKVGSEMIGIGSIMVSANDQIKSRVGSEAAIIKSNTDEMSKTRKSSEQDDSRNTSLSGAFGSGIDREVSQNNQKQGKSFSKSQNSSIWGWRVLSLSSEVDM